MANIRVRIDQSNDPATGKRVFSPLIAVDEAPATDDGGYGDAESAIGAVEGRLEQLFDPGCDVIQTCGRWYLTLTEAIDKLRFAFAVNSAPTLPGG